jgi:protein farnesyltransferase/geranylgeranyltransferase type-1 subunit alpha
VLGIDEKNFHAWSYFGWYADRFAKWTWLFDVTRVYIERDPINNSAWAARYRAVRMGNLSIDADIEYALRILKPVPRGEAICNYIRGLLAIEPTPERNMRVKVAIGEICEGKMKTRSVFQLAAHVALLQGNMEEYEQLIDQIVVLDPRRAQFWVKMRDEPSMFA